MTDVRVVSGERTRYHMLLEAHGRRRDLGSAQARYLPSREQRRARLASLFTFAAISDHHDGGYSVAMP